MADAPSSFFIAKLLGILTCCAVVLTHIAIEFGEVAQAQEHTTLVPHQPLPCLGYDPTSGEWAKQIQEVRSGDTAYDYFECPPNTAILSVFKLPMKPEEGKYIGIEANCCPLPASDILTNEHVEALTECPEGYVATGGRLPRYRSRQPRPLRCTKINTQRYQLGAAEQGQYWGAGGSGAFWMQERKRIQISSIPMGIRFGVIRYSETRNIHSGCIGTSYTSLLVGKHSKRCFGHRFRELQFRGLLNDPPVGSPVQIAPNCARISDIFDPNAECISDQE